MAWKEQFPQSQAISRVSLCTECRVLRFIGLGTEPAAPTLLHSNGTWVFFIYIKKHLLALSQLWDPRAHLSFQQPWLN